MVQETSGNGIELFESIPLFRSLSKEELIAMVNSSKETSFPSGAHIVKEGDAGLGFYIITEGQAHVKSSSGKILAKLGRGNFFGEMSLFDDQPRSADVIAAEQTKCLVLLKWNFWALISKNPQIARALLKELARRLRATNESLSE